MYIGKVQCLLCQEGLHDPWCVKTSPFSVVFFLVWYPKNQKNRYKEYLDLQNRSSFSFSTKHVFTQLGEKSCFHCLKAAMIIIWATRVCRCRFLKFHWQGCFVKHSFWPRFSRLASVTFFFWLPDYRRRSQKRMVFVPPKFGCRMIIGYVFSI